MLDSFSEIIIFMKVGDYGKKNKEKNSKPEKITRILPRIKALYESEKKNNPEAFYPFGYMGEYTAKSVRDLLGRHLAMMEVAPLSIDVIFSPIVEAYESWKECCRTDCFPDKFDLGPKKGAWRHMDKDVRGFKIFSEIYPTAGEFPKTYYGLLIEDLELFDSSTDDFWIDLRPYRRMIKEDINGWELRGRWRQKSAIPCFKTIKPSKVPKTPEPVIARAKLVYPYAVELSESPLT